MVWVSNLCRFQLRTQIRRPHGSEGAKRLPCHRRRGSSPCDHCEWRPHPKCVPLLRARSRTCGFGGRDPESFPLKISSPLLSALQGKPTPWAVFNHDLLGARMWKFGKF